MRKSSPGAKDCILIQSANSSCGGNLTINVSIAVDYGCSKITILAFLTLTYEIVTIKSLPMPHMQPLKGI